MKNHAFTLIELLVVVLIIGILAAVALPQYQKAVLKSRAMAALVYVKAVHDAEEVYYLSNGTYTNQLDDLDIQAVCPQNWVCGIYLTEDVYARNDEHTLAMVYYFDHVVPAAESDAVYVGALYCWARRWSEHAKQLCQSMGPEIVSDTEKVRHRLN